MLAAFGIEPGSAPDLARWQLINERIRNPEGEVTIAIVGKYTGMKDAYKSLIEALSHGGIANKVKVNLDWIESEVFEKEDPAPFLEHVNGILVPGGFGQRGAEGKIRAAQFARERNVPYFGICFGMQMAVIEAARNLCRHRGRELDRVRPDAGAGGRPDDRMAQGQRAGEARRPTAISAAPCGSAPIRRCSTRGSQVAEIYGATEISERHRHRYEVNTAYKGRLEQHGMRFCRHVARRRAARDHRIRRPSLVHRRAVPPRAEVAAVRAASAVRVVHRRGGGAEPAGVSGYGRFGTRSVCNVRDGAAWRARCRIHRNDVHLPRTLKHNEARRKGGVTRARFKISAHSTAKAKSGPNSA